MSSIFRPISLVQACKLCGRRLLSDKPRKRTWILPAIESNNPSSTSLSKPTLKQANPRQIQPTSKAPSAKMVFTPFASKKNTQLRTTSKPSPVSTSKTIQPTSEVADWRARKIALKKKYPEGWNPTKKISPDAMEGIRILRKHV